MAVESAADIDAMFDIGDFAETVQYGRGGPTTAKSAIMSLPSGLAGGGVRALGAEAVLRASELPSNVGKRGDTLIARGITYKVEEAEPDLVGQTWRLFLSYVSGP